MTTTRFFWCFAPRYGLAGLRIGQRYWQFKAPWCVPLYSERYGYRRTLFKLWGWRLLLDNRA